MSYNAKGFTCWGQFVAMLFCQLGQARSLREICGGLSSCLGKLKHLGIDTAPSRSTLSYANEKRPWQLYEKVFYQLLDKCRAIAPGKKKFRFKNKLFSLDASVIDLCATLFDWATFRQTKGAVKLHLLLDHDGYLPVFASITEGNVHEINIVKGLSFPRGSYLKFRSHFAWSISNLIAMLRYNLFTYRDLWTWIDSPYETPPVVPMGEQLALGL